MTTCLISSCNGYYHGPSSHFTLLLVEINWVMKGSTRAIPLMWCQNGIMYMYTPLLALEIQTRLYNIAVDFLVVMANSIQSHFCPKLNINESLDNHHYSPFYQPCVILTIIIGVQAGENQCNSCTCQLVAHFMCQHPCAQSKFVKMP